MHPIQRRGCSAKRREFETISMHTRTKGSLNTLYLGVLLSVLCCSQPLFAQALKDRVLQAVDASQVTAIRGNMHSPARPGFDQGRVDPTMPMRVTNTFKMTPAPQADLDALLAAQQERGSPDYHR